jgi:hypothetical protein
MKQRNIWTALQIMTAGPIIAYLMPKQASLAPDLYALRMQLALHLSALLQLQHKLKIRAGLPTNSHDMIGASIRSPC